MLQPLPWAPVMLGSERDCLSQVAPVKGKEKQQQEASEGSLGDTASVVPYSPVSLWPPPSGVHLISTNTQSDRLASPHPLPQGTGYSSA